jgi:hypothetical protein
MPATLSVYSGEQSKKERRYLDPPPREGISHLILRKINPRLIRGTLLFHLNAATAAAQYHAST